MRSSSRDASGQPLYNQPRTPFNIYMFNMTDFSQDLRRWRLYFPAHSVRFLERRKEGISIRVFSSIVLAVKDLFRALCSKNRRIFMEYKVCVNHVLRFIVGLAFDLTPFKFERCSLLAYWTFYNFRILSFQSSYFIRLHFLFAYSSFFGFLNERFAWFGRFAKVLKMFLEADNNPKGISSK